MNPFIERTCSRKRGYLNRRDAKRAIRRLKTRTGDRGIHPYHCRICLCWHAGHRVPARWRKE